MDDGSVAGPNEQRWNSLGSFPDESAADALRTAETSNALMLSTVSEMSGTLEISRSDMAVWLKREE